MFAGMNTLFTNDTPGKKLCQNFTMVSIIPISRAGRMKPSRGNLAVNNVDVRINSTPLMHTDLPFPEPVFIPAQFKSI